MKELWVCLENYQPEYFDCKETAQIAYRKWCKQYQEDYDESIFEMCYKPIEEMVTIWTKETIKDYIPD